MRSAHRVVNRPESEFEPRLKSPQKTISTERRLKLEAFNTILSGTNHII